MSKGVKKVQVFVILLKKVQVFVILFLKVHI